jgi:flagellar hook assembly protein FlgD
MSLETAREGSAEVVIYDIVGRRVSTLHEGPLGAGRHELRWDRRDARGVRASAGVYFVRAVSGGATRTQRLVLVD